MCSMLREKVAFITLPCVYVLDIKCMHNRESLFFNLCFLPSFHSFVFFVFHEQCIVFPFNRCYVTYMCMCISVIWNSFRNRHFSRCVYETRNLQLLPTEILWLKFCFKQSCKKLIILYFLKKERFCVSDQM